MPSEDILDDAFTKPLSKQFVYLCQLIGIVDAAFPATVSWSVAGGASSPPPPGWSAYMLRHM